MNLEFRSTSNLHRNLEKISFFHLFVCEPFDFDNWPLVLRSVDCTVPAPVSFIFMVSSFALPVNSLFSTLH